MTRDLFSRARGDAGARATAGGAPSASASASVSVDGVLDRIVYQDEERGFTVARLTVEGRPDPVTAVGALAGVQVGETLRVRGAFTVDPRYGEQLRVESFASLRPSTLAGIERYLGSGLVPGIGRAMAARLVERFGHDTLDVVEHHAERLTEVEGIGPVRSRRIRDAWAEQRGIREVMVFLQSHGVGAAHAIRIYKKYGQGAIARVREDPYRLAVDVFGIGFLTADRIAASLGIPKDSPRRAAAGVLHALSELCDAGHVFAPRADLVAAAATMLEVDAALAEAAVGELAREERVVVEPLPGGGEAVYLDWLHAAEAGAAARLGAILRTPATAVAVDVARAVEWFEARRGLVLAPEQRRAVERAVAPRGDKVLVLTGGPGTGKTTIIDAIVSVLERKGRRVLLCAPTGRAARRMSQATGREARTLHRLLEFGPGGGFQRDESRPLEADLVVVDETSMVDIALFAELLRAVPPACQLLLVGDVDQLPSVGPGSVLRDLIRSGAVAVARLTEIFRQAAASLIVTNAHRIHRGELPRAPAEGDAAADFFVVEREEPDDVLAVVKDLVARRIPRRFGLDGVDDVQVLTPMQRGTLGAAHLNAELQGLLNPPVDGAPSLARGARSFRAGDKVMQVRNDYERDVYNGDLGRVVRVDEAERQLVVRFDDREVTYDAGDLDELVLAYAATIHKAQGSEYPAVVVPLHTQHYVMLQRNLLYTAVTRGKRLVVLVGNRRALALAVRTERLDGRHSRLAERVAAAARR